MVQYWNPTPRMYKMFFKREMASEIVQSAKDYPLMNQNNMANLF